jgi:hypothetical protein
MFGSNFTDHPHGGSQDYRNMFFYNCPSCVPEGGGGGGGLDTNPVQIRRGKKKKERCETKTENRPPGYIPQALEDMDILPACKKERNSPP